MIDKKDLIKEIEKEFASIKKDFSIEFDLDYFNSEFGILNAVYDKGFVPSNFELALISLVTNKFKDLHGYFNSLLVPGGQYLAMQTEAKLFSSETDRKMIWNMIRKIMEVSSRSALLIHKGDRKESLEFVRDMAAYWTGDFKPKVIDIFMRVNKAWGEEEDGGADKQ